MKAFILGLKHNSKHIFDENGCRIPVTSLIVSPCYLVQIKTIENDGYFAAVLAVGNEKKSQKSKLGLFKKANIEENLRFVKEIRIPEKSEITLIEKDQKKGLKIGEKEIMVGEKINPTTFFSKGDMITVCGTSKGKGFQGVVKRHDFAGMPASHGYPHQRVPGSIGQTTTPGRVFKGLRMAGRMGSDTITVKNLRLMEMSESEILVKGLLPGNKKGLLTVIA